MGLSNINYAERLREFPLLSNIKDNELRILAGMMNERQIAAGENIITEGESGDEVYILMEGTVDVIKSTVFGDLFVGRALRLHPQHRQRVFAEVGFRQPPFVQVSGVIFRSPLRFFHQFGQPLFRQRFFVEQLRVEHLAFLLHARSTRTARRGTVFPRIRL